MEATKDLKNYEDYLFCRELSEGTRMIYVREADLFLDYLEGRNITKKEVISYKNRMSESGISISTQNLYITAVNCYLRYAGYGDCLIKLKQVQRKKSLDNVISLEEYQSLLKYAMQSGRFKYFYIIKTLALTGIRISELKYFTVEALEKDVLTVNNKGKTREIYLTDELVKSLRRYCAQEKIEHGIIFRGNTCQPISRIAVYKMLVHMADMMGIPKEKVHPHSFRHLFALTYMKHFANLPELADILGHSSLESTRIYTTSSVQEKRQRMNELGL